MLDLTLRCECVEDVIVSRTGGWRTHTVQVLGLHLRHLPLILTVRSSEQSRPLVVEGEDPPHLTAAAQRITLQIIRVPGTLDDFFFYLQRTVASILPCLYEGSPLRL